MSDYIIDAAAERELARLRLLEDWADPGSIRCLDAVGVGTGWHCLEVGAGAGSMAAWLAGRVGPTGHVVASDVDTRFLQGGTQANVTVLQHDLREGPPPAGPFDVVHARLLLEHLPAVDRAIGHLCAALKPGGVLVIEDQDICSVVVGDTSDPRAASFLERSSKLVGALTAHGVDLQLGRKLHGHLTSAGLVDVSAEGRVPVVRGGDATARFWQATWEGLRLPLTRSGFLESAAIDETVRLLADPSFVWQAPMVVAAWGRVRPV